MKFQKKRSWTSLTLKFVSSWKSSLREKESDMASSSSKRLLRDKSRPPSKTWWRHARWIKLIHDWLHTCKTPKGKEGEEKHPLIKNIHKHTALSFSIAISRNDCYIVRQAIQYNTIQYSSVINLGFALLWMNIMYVYDWGKRNNPGVCVKPEGKSVSSLKLASPLSLASCLSK